MPIDTDLIHRCADPSLAPAIVETFVKAIGSSDPLSITVRSGNRIVLMPVAKTPDDALAIIRKHVGHAMVRVGIKDPSEVSPDLLDTCANLSQGTALFGRVRRIVLNWYGNPTDESVLPQVLEDATEAWKTGTFEGSSVFTTADPGPSKLSKMEVEDGEATPTGGEPRRTLSEASALQPNEAGIRVDLSAYAGVR